MAAGPKPSSFQWLAGIRKNNGFPRLWWIYRRWGRRRSAAEHNARWRKSSSECRDSSGRRRCFGSQCGNPSGRWSWSCLASGRRRSSRSAFNYPKWRREQNGIRHSSGQTIVWWWREGLGVSVGFDPLFG